jgi:hypothetical protein
MVEPTAKAAARQPPRGDRYWRTVLRKLGESLDLAGKALIAAGAAAILAPLATKAALRVPTLSITTTLILGLAFVLLGIHFQALEAMADPHE